MASKRRKKADGAGVNVPTILIVLLVAWLAYQLLKSDHHKPDDLPNRDDVVVVDDDDQKSPDSDEEQPDDAASNLDLKKHLLIVIRDQQVRDADMTTLLQDDDFWGTWCADNLGDVEDLDDGDEIARGFIKEHSLQIPIVMLVNTETKRVVWQIPAPKTTDEIRAKLK